MAYSNKLNVNILTDLLVKHGVRHAVVCPGSRNAPIVHNLGVHPSITCHPVTDERSAGFVAMGLSQADRYAPVVVCVTSGTALLNLLPAVAEAYYQHVPVIVISADRPAAWIGQQDGQTLPQPDALGRFVLKAVSLPEVLQGEKEEEEHWHCNRLVNEALLWSYARNRKGPVHINVPLSEPLYEFTQKSLPQERVISFHANAHLDEDTLQLLLTRFKKAKKPMIVFGQMQSTDTYPYLPAGIPCAVHLTDQLSYNYDAMYHEDPDDLENYSDGWTVSGHYDEVLSQVMDDAEYLPDFILYVGGEIVSKRLKQFLRKADQAEVWRVSADDSELPDTFMHLTHFLQAHPGEVLSELENSEDLSGSRITPWVDRWNNAMRKVSRYVQSYVPPFSNILAIRLFHGMLSGHERTEEVKVIYGNSSAIRLANIFADCHVYCNRGVNGIEGTLSTAAGMALLSPQNKVFCVLGDLSFFYDDNALWNEQLQGNLRILLLNNGGGGIFGKFEGLKKSKARDMVMALHATSAKGICQAHNVRYIAAKNEKELCDGLYKLINCKSQHPVVLEVMTSIDIDNNALKEYYDNLPRLQ